MSLLLTFFLSLFLHSVWWFTLQLMEYLNAFHSITLLMIPTLYASLHSLLKERKERPKRMRMPDCSFLSFLLDAMKFAFLGP